MCVATEDVIRGLDISLDTVVIVGKAAGPDNYVHIAGRCGRAGRRGSCVSVVGYEDSGRINGWSSMLGVEFEPVEAEDVAGSGI
ncbi:hypothetical protein TeGR_g14359 [Tetraparma gracilis]|uniref:Helicase C-terminal domain-containing protein n=1 Tax=Tetraparma gracilis TaxID=2962635 RepID=A0ABQ6MB77_9STRA|nr:hypothetical protein TeGR_g14359 [Tetraparma gracilis]